MVKHRTTKGARRGIKEDNVSKGVKSRRMTGVRIKVLCTTRIVKKQRSANIAVENIELAGQIVLRLTRDARPVELSIISRLRLWLGKTGKRGQDRDRKQQ